MPTKVWVPANGWGALSYTAGYYETQYAWPINGSSASMAGGSFAPTTASKPDNSSPLGLAIPMFDGTVAVNGSIIVDIDLIGGIRLKDGGKIVANLVIQFADTSLGGACDLVWLKANDEFIFRDQTPKRSLSGLTFYGGGQTAVDPTVAEYITNPTCYPKMAYAVLKDFDLTPYSGQLPTFRACISSSVTAASATEEDATLSFGSYSGYLNSAMGYDATRGVAYQVVYDGGVGTYIGTFDVESGTETRRVAITGTASDDYFYGLLALPGSDYVVGQTITLTSPSSLYGLYLINARTGAIEATLDAVQQTGGSGYFEPGLHSAYLLKSDTATKYVVLGYTYGSTGIVQSTVGTTDGIVCIADVTNGTLEYIVHPDEAGGVPLRSTSGQPQLEAWALKSISNGVLTAYFTEYDGQTVYEVQIGDSGIVSVATGVYTTSGANLTGVAYDSIDNALVVTRDDDALIKYDLDTSTQTYSVSLTSIAPGVVTPFLNAKYDASQHAVRDGYGIILSNDTMYIVDLADGSTTELISLGGDFSYYDQYRGKAIEPSTLTNGTVYIYTFGDLTPNAVDAQDILTALETYTGEYSSGDLTFTNFSGNECKGILIDVDGTISSFVDNVAGTFGIRRSHDGGKIKFKYPVRDGSYAVDRVLDNNDIVLANGEAIAKTEMDEDSALEAGTLDFIDADADFARSSAAFQRPNGLYKVIGSNRQENFSTSLVMSATQAAKALQRMVYETDYDRSSYSLSLMPQNADLEPGDIIQFPYGPSDEITVVGEIRVGDLLENFSQDIETTEYLQAIETALVGTGLTMPAVTNLSTTSDMVILDTALLRTSDDLNGAGLRGYAVFIGSGTGNIPASSFYQSTDGYDYTRTGYASDVAPIAGVITGSITRNYSDGYQTDYDGTFSVLITAGDIDTLATTTNDNFYALTNYAAIGQEGRWVLIAYKTVSSSSGVATLSEIIWGLHGTEVYLSSLVTGDQFINLEYGEVLAYANAASLINDPVYYKGGYSGWLVASLPTKKVTADGEAEKPYATVDGAATVTAGGVQFTCYAQERLGIVPVLAGVKSAGYSEGGISIEWDIYDNGSPQTKLRTLTSTVENVTYTNAQIAADFGSLPSSIMVKRYQLSKLGFRGHAATQVYTISNPTTFDTSLISFDSSTVTWDAAA